MASWAALVTTTLYTTQLTAINDRDVDCAKALDPAYVTVTSPLTNSVRFNSANKRRETYNGSAWVELIAAATDAYAETVTGLRGGTLYGANALAASATLTGGAGSSIDVPTLKQGGSAAWTAATLTNLNQLTNGPAYITASALSSYALLASPALTGTPTAPTAAVDTSTTQLATTAYVVNQSYLKSATAATTYAPLASPSLTGTPLSTTAAVDTNTTQIATTAYVVGQGYLKSATAASTYAALTGANFTGTVSIIKAAAILLLRDTGGSGSAMSAYTSLQDAGGVERGWVGFGQGTTEMRVTNGIGVLNLLGTAVQANSNVVLHASNYNTYAPTLTGTGASGSWGISVTGSSASCTGNAATATNVAASGLTGATLASGVTASSLTSFGASIALGTPASGNLANCTFPTLNQNTTGSAGSVAAANLTGSTLASGVTGSSLTSVAAGATVGGIEIGYRRLVAGSVTTGSVAAADSGKGIYASAGVTIPNSTFAQGDIITIYNNTSSAVTITNSLTTGWFNGASIGASKSLAARSMCSVWFISGTEAIYTGSLS